MTYHIITYGCQMNKSDSERIAYVLEKTGYKPEDNENRADLIVINMCSVRQSAVDRVYSKIQNAKCKNKNGKSKCKIILTGCILEKDKNKLKDKVDLIFNIRDLPKLPEKLLAIGQWSNRTIERSNNRTIKQWSNGYLQILPKHKSKFSAYVPIMTGCNNFCSYCVVPYLRGPEYSRPTEKIIDEIRHLVKRGYKEIILLGQNVNSYKPKIQISNIKSNPKLKCQKMNFSKLLRMVNDIPGDFWIRFLTSHPKDMTDELIKTIAKCDKICEYIHLPVQSGDDKILKRMNRGYTIKHYTSLIKKIRKTIPGIAISTDIIVGFPGETKKQFENTAKSFREIKFDMAYIAQYSPRSETTAFKLKDDVSQKEKKRREKVLTKILAKTALGNNKKYIGKIVEILVNSSKQTKDSRYISTGKTRTFKNVRFFPDSKFKIPDSNLVGQFAKAKITDATSWGLKGIIFKK